ncbi:PLAT/LH2 domain-containing protein [Actinosynnema sp. CS-041913]|uniref:PLAT/LH2 domain-containing protein n=1 Tax=Actinosynnema sp. CS-041913 TaxID=3239917 RepID=UPI003D90E6C9
MLAVIAGAVTAQAVPAGYAITTKTCDVPNAGTDANVEARLAGAGGLTEWIVLNHSGDDREQGRFDTYSKTLQDVGPVIAIDLTFDNAGDSPHWCLEEVVITGPHGTTTHPFHNWLTTKITKSNPLRLLTA